jgi:hypothetical protein
MGREDDMGQAEEITAAWDAWRDAKRAYDDEAAPYVGVPWAAAQSPHSDPGERASRRVRHADKLTRLRAVESQQRLRRFCRLISSALK